MTQFVLYGGKGGVGKSTMAGATGLLASNNDYKTLVISTDPAHSLSDALETDVDDTPTQIKSNPLLDAIEIDPKQRFRERYGDDFNQILNDVKSLGVDVQDRDIDAITERGLIPGADEVAVLDLFVEYDDHPEYEVVIFDTAPTGHTLRLLNLPDVMNTTLGRLLSLRGRLTSVAGTVGKLFGREDNSITYSDRVDRLESITENVGDRLRNGDRTEFRAVTLPESMAIAETRRLLSQLDEDEISVGCIIMNRVLQDASPDCSTCWPRYQDQKEQISIAESEFAPAIHQIPLLSGTSGFDRIDKIAGMLDNKLDSEF